MHFKAIPTLRPSKPAPAGWVRDLERSKAELQAGQSVPLEPVLDGLRATIARLKSKTGEA